MSSPNPRRIPRYLASLLFSVGAWSLILSLFLLVRVYGTGDTPDWLTGPGPVVIMVLLGGTLFGALDWGGNLLIDHSRLRARPFWVLLAVKALSLTIALFVMILLARLFAVALGQLTFAAFPGSYLETITSTRVAAGGVYLAASALGMAFIRQTAAMVGSRVLLNLMLGRYHHPREEELIFMFLDMKSSTTIAEKIGHQKFSRLLQDCFRDLTDVALKYRVEIYKYVGDEAILTWHPTDGLNDANCIRTFFGFQEALAKRRVQYEAAYGCFPEFRAGLNMGPVTVAEVGVLKREIAYLSDVLNTAARIQGKCKDLAVSLLLAGSVRARLPDGPYRFQPQGEIELRGREEAVTLFSVEP